MLSQMSAEELDDWEALDREDPIGQLRDDWRVAQLAAHIVSGMFPRQRFAAEDFLLRFKTLEEIERQRKPMSADDLEKIFRMIAERHNASLASGKIDAS